MIAAAVICFAAACRIARRPGAVKKTGARMDARMMSLVLQFRVFSVGFFELRVDDIVIGFG